MRLTALYPLAFSFLVGCTTYKPEGFTGGFAEMKLSENVFQVTARGNAFAGSREIQEMALLRSAEVVLANGFRYFELAKSTNEIKVERSYSPPQTYTTGTIRNYGSYSQLNATTQQVGGGPIDWEKPHSMNLVVAYKDRPSDGKAYIDAELILQSLGPKYIKGKK